MGKYSFLNKSLITVRDAPTRKSGKRNYVTRCRLIGPPAPPEEHAALEAQWRRNMGDEFVDKAITEVREHGEFTPVGKHRAGIEKIVDDRTMDDMERQRKIRQSENPFINPINGKKFKGKSLKKAIEEKFGENKFAESCGTFSEGRKIEEEKQILLNEGADKDWVEEKANKVHQKLLTDPSLGSSECSDSEVTKLPDDHEMDKDAITEPSVGDYMAHVNMGDGAVMCIEDTERIFLHWRFIRNPDKSIREDKSLQCECPTCSRLSREAKAAYKSIQDQIEFEDGE